MSDPAALMEFPSVVNFGVYVHVPFCAHACDFCAFYQVEPQRGDIERYLTAIAREFELVEPPGACDTAFWGGGTPSVLPPRDLARLGQAQLARFGAPRREWTVELAPGSVKAEKLRVLRELGVDRVSLGVQSFSPRVLAALGRRDSAAQVQHAWTLIREAGFRSANLDLIFAVPGQSPEEWRADCEAALALEPDHISTYCLTFEEDTAMFARLSEGRIQRDVEREREFFLATWDHLEAAGYRQYEISNFARPGHACVHNLNTWRMHEWAGFGPSAASQHGGTRGANAADLATWIAAVERGERAAHDRVALSPGQLVEDALIFGLRMIEGVSWPELAARFGAATLAPHEPVVRRLIADGLAECTAGEARDVAGDRLRLTRAGRLVADAIGAEFIGVAAPAAKDAGRFRTGCTEPRSFDAARQA